VLVRRARAGQVKRSSSPFAVDVVQRLHEPGAGFGLFGAQLDAQLFGVGALQVHHHDASLGVSVAGAVDVPHDGAGQFCEVRAVAAG